MMADAAAGGRADLDAVDSARFGSVASPRARVYWEDLLYLDVLDWIE